MADIITEEQEQELIRAIQQAEAQTSGEIKVHIEPTCNKDVMDRAVEVFASLHMHQTKLRNGVLFYIATESRKFAVIGDGGINAVVPANFWDEVKQTVLSSFKDSKFSDGLCAGITLAGRQLKTYFPYDARDVNELSDDISFGKSDE